MPSLITSFPLFHTSDPDIHDTSFLRPSDTTEPEEKKWTDAELMDDARPGRRGDTDSQCWKYEVPTKAVDKDVDEGEYLPHPLYHVVNNEDGKVHVVKSWYCRPADEGEVVKAVGRFRGLGSVLKGAKKAGGS